MDRTWSRLAALLALLMWNRSVSAQQPSLADIARQEQERRATVGTPAPMYTNDDLEDGDGGVRARRTRLSPTPGQEAPAESSGGQQSPARAGSSRTAPSDSAVEAERGESYWRDRVFSNTEARRRTDVVAAALQNRVDGLWAEFTARDDPYERTTIEQQRKEALQWLERTRETSNRLKQETVTIHEEARRAGVPPGWLRD